MKRVDGSDLQGKASSEGWQASLTQEIKQYVQVQSAPGVVSSGELFVVFALSAGKGLQGFLSECVNPEGVVVASRVRRNLRMLRDFRRETAETERSRMDSQHRVLAVCVQEQVAREGDRHVRRRTGIHGFGSAVHLAKQQQQVF